MTTAKINTSSAILTCVSLFAAILMFFLFSGTAIALDLFIGAEKEGSLSHFTGKNICRIIQLNENDIQCKIVETDNSTTDNLTNLNTGALDLALIDSGILHDAVNHLGIYKFFDISFENVSYLLPMYKKHISLLVRKKANISTLDDLRGKRLNIGNPGSDQFRISKTILDIKKWTEKDFKQLEQLSSSQSQDYLAFNFGSVQAMFHVGVHPNLAIQSVLESENGELVNMNDSEMDEFVERNLGYFYLHIPAKTYPYQTRHITTYGTEVALLANKDLDNELVIATLNALLKKQDWLRKSHPALGLFSLEKNLLTQPVVDYHLGADSFFSQ